MTASEPAGAPGCGWKRSVVSLEKLFVSGNEAVARGAWETGLAVACAYPGTPSSEILETLASFPGVDAQWSVNEKVAYEVALGAAIGGARSLFACKHVGLNVAMDPLMTSAYTGVKAGFVVVVADDPGMHSSQNEQDTRWVSIYAKLPLLEPSSPAEAYEFVREAFAVSERFDTPVLPRLTTRVSHTKENIEVGGRAAAERSPFVPDIAKYVMMPRNAYERHIRVEERIERLREYAEASPLNRFEPGTGTAVITSGVAYNYVREALPGVPVLKLGMSYPFPDAKIRDFASRFAEVLVVEELDPFVEAHVRSLGIAVRPTHPSYRIGELGPDAVAALAAGEPRDLRREPGRKPVLCPGCGHRAVFAALKKLKVVVAGDIGCYTLAATPPLAAMHTTICMGAGVTVHEGLGRALKEAQPAGDDRPRIVGVIGDSTFVHSGITGLVNAVYNRAEGLIIILDNSTTAMTGGQNHPGTGRTIREQATARLDLEGLCRACGVASVDVIDPYRYPALMGLIRKRLDEPGLAVIISRRPCKLHDRERKPAPAYHRDLCRACGLCLKIDCPAIKELEGGFVAIDESICTGCDLCVEICPFGALTSRSPEEAAVDA
jgi:indolepyruvate ferredoxin oxidoreductase alpha subunit